MPKKRSRKPFKHKWPKSWRPGIGETKAKKDWAPSVVRDRNPMVRTLLNGGKLLGHTHAIFVANPGCCSLCQKHNGRRQRLDTVLRWKYVLPHCNCLCTWRTEKVVRKGEHVLQSELLSKSNIKHVFYKAEIAGSGVVEAAGKHREKVKVTRGGKTFYQERLVGRKEEDKEPKKDTFSTADVRWGKTGERPEKGDKVRTRSPKAHDDHKGVLNKIVDALRKLKPGSSGKVGDYDVERHSDGNHFRISGLVARGFRAASVLMMGIERISASAGQTVSGSLGAGAEMAQGGQATKDVQAAGAKATGKVSEVEAKHQARVEHHRRVKEKHSKVAEKHQKKQEAAAKRSEKSEEKAKKQEDKLEKLTEDRSAETKKPDEKKTDKPEGEEEKNGTEKPKYGKVTKKEHLPINTVYRAQGGGYKVVVSGGSDGEGNKNPNKHEKTSPAAPDSVLYEEVRGGVTKVPPKKKPSPKDKGKDF